MEDARLRKNAPVPQVSKFIKEEALPRQMRTSYLQNPVQDVKELLVMEENLDDHDCMKEFDFNCFTQNKDYPVN